MSLPAPPRHAAPIEVAPQLVVVAVMCAVMFFIALTLFEVLPEIPVDIDFKPFFIPLAFVVLLPRGAPVFAAAIGAMLGEFLRDALEGYEIDDPIGAVGYVVGFVAAAYVVGDRPLSRGRLVVAAAVAGALHAVIEASSFVLFSAETAWVAIYSGLGNTLADGLVMGALPLVFVVPALHGRLERYLGYPPRRAAVPER